MSLRTGTRNILALSIVLLALAPISMFAEEHKSESRPASHASKPSRPANQNHGGSSRPSNPSRPNNGGGNAHPGGGAGARPGGNGGSRPGGGTPNRPNNPGGNNGSVNRGGNGGVNRGGNQMGNRGGNQMGNRGAAGGRSLPGRSVALRGGGSASIRPNGQIRSINRNGMQIQRNLNGNRTIVSQRGGATIVTTGRGNGYVQRAYVTRGGYSYYSRTYYDHGVYRVGVYRGYYYGGFRYYGYRPAFWYHPGFYGWAYRPWGAPIYWGVGIGGWGWAGAPWWGFYGGWFTPYPVYPSAAFWLTDYLISANLQAAYAAQGATASDAAGYDAGSSNYSDGGGQASNSAPVTLTPEVKQAISEEVKAQLAEQQQDAGSPGQGAAPDSSQAAPPDGAAPAPADNQVPPALDPARRTFVVHTDLTVVSDGQECELTGGDVLTRLTDTPDGDQKVTASVSASKKNDCAAGKQVLVSVNDLQEMRNHFEEQLDSGMKALAEKQGTGGMPKAPDTGTVASDIPAPAPDTTAAKDLSDQEAAADQAEADAKQEAVAPSSGGQD